MVSTPTVLDFRTDRPNAASQIDKWAQDHRAKLERTDADGTREYSWGWWHGGLLWAGLPGDRTCLSIRVTDGAVHIECWRSYGAARRIITFGLLPGQLGIESGSVRDLGGRNHARLELNELIAGLGGPAIP